MDNNEFNMIVEQTVNETLELLAKKGLEYSSGDDRLSNFKRVAQYIGCTPLQVALIYMSKHVDGLSTYIRKDAGEIEQELTEPIDGRINDLINYCYLIKALIHETPHI